MPSRNIDDVEYRRRVDAYLELFDGLDLDEKPHRRTAVWLLDELFRRTLADVGREYLGFSSINKRDNMKVLWSKTLGRFEIADSFEEPKDYTAYVEQLHRFRNQNAHNTDYDPPQANLENIRDDTQEWLDWLFTEAHRYDSESKQWSPRELMIKTTKRTLEKILSETKEEDIINGLENWHAEIRSNAERLQAELEALEEEDGVSVELVDILVQSLELTHDYEQLQKTEAEFWNQVETRIDEHIVNRDPFV